MRALLLLACAAAAAANSQVHLALGHTEDAITAAWVSTHLGHESEVYWGLSPGNLSSHAKGDRKFYVAQLPKHPFYTRTATMSNLAVGQTYYYKVGDSHNGYSDVFSFRNRRAAQSAPYYHVLFGDMGAKAAFTLCTACTQGSLYCNATTCAQNTTVGLVSEVDKADMFLHVGDFAYDLASDDGHVGDRFMENIEQVAARVPYMVSHGNHEDYEADLAQYLERFRSQPVNSEPKEVETYAGISPNTLYFSWDYGMVHYISFSTELWVESFAKIVPLITKKKFLKWLEEDLQKANLAENRAKNPWIVVHGHRPLYSSVASGASDTDVRSDLEPLFFKYGVSFSVNGHQHSYERSWPTYQSKSDQTNVNPNATIYIVTGAAGSSEMHSPFGIPQPSWGAFRSNTFGYTRMLVHNASHLHLQQVRTDPDLFPLSGYGDVIDDVWIVQNNQGPFSVERAPKSAPTSCSACESHDHFDPILRPMLGDKTTRPLHEVIQEYRKTHGDVAWAHKLDELLAHLNTRGSSATWEDGLLDNKEEAALKWIYHGGQ